jgi:alpha-beta hydrolase superfamily lysophospholipase
MPVTGRPAAPNLRFTERMRGWVSFDVRDYNSALIAGRRARNRCSANLVVEIDDLDAFERAPVSRARLVGTVHCPRLGGRLEGEDGHFTLFAPAPDARRRRMLYRLFARDSEGRRLTFSGFKLVEDDPNHDVWRDTSRLLARILAGHVAQDSELDDDPRVVATGILRITPLGLARCLLTMRGGPGMRLRAPFRYQREFARTLLQVYRGRALPSTQYDFPVVTVGATPLQGRRPGQWHELPCHPGLRRRVLPFEAGDGRELNLHNIRGPRKPTREPVLLVCGLAMRANSFYDAPSRPTLVDALVHEGYDVWVENWRTSIDLPAEDYTLDGAAVYDHPAAIRTIRSRTDAEKLSAIAHCMGSTSLAMSVVAGLANELHTVVSSAVSLHVHLDSRSKRRLATLLPVSSLLLRMRGADPQWAARAPSVKAASLARMAQLAIRNYRNPLNAAATFIYGSRADGMWQLDQLDADTLDWLGREFGYSPFSFFRQIRESAREGQVVPVEGLPQLPPDLAERPPPDHVRFTFLAGMRNQFFLASGQERTYKEFDKAQPRRHRWVPLEGYSHLDVLIGRRWYSDVFPHIRKALRAGADGAP